MDTDTNKQATCLSLFLKYWTKMIFIMEILVSHTTDFIINYAQFPC